MLTKDKEKKGKGKGSSERASSGKNSTRKGTSFSKTKPGKRDSDEKSESGIENVEAE